MTIATKNGVPIVKDGAIASGCGCCGGWYCCPEPECALDTINSVTVSITPQSQQWLRHSRSGSAFVVPNFANTICGYDQFTTAIPCSSVAGTWSLQKLSSTLWRAVLPTDVVGCFQPTISLSRQSFSQSSGVWSFSAMVPAYYWFLRTKSSSEPFKTLSDMQCQSTPPQLPQSGLECRLHAENTVEYAAQLKQGLIRSQGFQCSPRSTVTFSSNLTELTPVFSPLLTSYATQHDVNQQIGSRSCSVTITIE